MHLKAPHPVGHLEGKNASMLIEVYFECLQLKHLYRQGWLHHGVDPQRCESVAEHSFGVALLALFLADAAFPELDRLKVLRMALLHDIGEIYVGDLTPRDHVSREEKVRREREAVIKVLGKLPAGADYIALWEDYEAQASPEAHFIRQLDRLEMALQASLYEHQEGMDLSVFFAATRQRLTSSALQTMLQDLEAIRDGSN